MPAAISLKISGLDKVQRDLVKTSMKLSDLDFASIANQGMRLAAAFAPRRSGALAASIKASQGPNRATIRAGGARVPYAGPINYGWRTRGIAPASFMERADAVLRRSVPALLEAQMRRIISGQGVA